MTEILGDLIIKKISDTNWEYMSPVEYRMNNGRILQIERGFKLDFGSTSVFRGIQPAIGTAADSGFGLHDRGYWGHRENRETIYTREEIDDYMLEVHLYCGVDPTLAKAIHDAVRIFGFEAWMTDEERVIRDSTDNHEWLDQ